MLNIQVDKGNVNLELSGTLSQILSEFTVASIALYSSLQDGNPEEADVFRGFLENGIGVCFDRFVTKPQKESTAAKPQKESTADFIALLIRLLEEKQ